MQRTLSTVNSQKIRSAHSSEVNIASTGESVLTNHVTFSEPMPVVQIFTKSPQTATRRNYTNQGTGNKKKTMSATSSDLGDQSLDSLLFKLESLGQNPELSEVVTSYLGGHYKSVLRNATSQILYRVLVETVDLPQTQQEAALQDAGLDGEVGAVHVLITGLAALDAFLQANVTGPPLALGDVFLPAGGDGEVLREKCLRSLDVDGMSVYQHIPYVELLCLAKMIFTVYFPRRMRGAAVRDSRWMRIRVNAYHQRLLAGVSGGRLSDSTVLQDGIEKDLRELEGEVLHETSTFSTEAKVQFLLEKAQIYISQGLDIKARENVERAKTVSGFRYALSGALGKRTKFQQNDLSQLVVFAKSSDTEYPSTDTLASALEGSKIATEDSTKPEALPLNDDTLLETIEFVADKVDASSLPPALADLSPNAQPQLKPLDQITLLTEATIKDTFLPLDQLNREEVLPYALRVLADRPTNWQIYTQALLVRSRIESHRSRTQERSILQLQVIVDQIIADTQDEPSSDHGVPEIRVSQFLPRAKASESAPITERLKYIYPLNTPTRWELESELAYAWSSAGSFVSALEIFKRLHLWAETALCYHAIGQEDRARQIIRRQLYFSRKGPEMDGHHLDSIELVSENWEGDLRPTPPHAPRLWCILGDLDHDPACWRRAWEISKHRYARAQRSLGEFYVKSGELEEGREAYLQATLVSRQNPDSWSRLGDLDLRLGNWDGAIRAFQQSIMIDDTDAKTYSNLGSAFVSKHRELVTREQAAVDDDDDGGGIPLPLTLPVTAATGHDVHVNDGYPPTPSEEKPSPQVLLTQALSAYKRAAALAHTNWQIWDNVITIAGRLSPPAFGDLLLGLRHVIRIRGPTVGEAAIDVEILRLLVAEVTTAERTDDEQAADHGGKYVPPRGSLARAVMAVVAEDIVPLITRRGEIWLLVEKLYFYQRDFEPALRCAEKAWRLLVGAGGEEEWLRAPEAWRGVVAVTENLISAYENYGPLETEAGAEVEKAWRGRARSAIRGVMARARDTWEGTEGWAVLEERLADLRA